MKKFLFTSGLIINSCFFAAADEGNGVPPPPPAGVVPPPPKIPTPPTNIKLPKNQNTSNDVEEHLENIRKGKTLKHVEQDKNSGQLDLKDRNYTKDDFDWNAHYDYLISLKEKQANSKNLFENLKNIKSKFDEKLFSIENKEQDQSKYYEAKKIKVKDLYKEIIQFAEKQLDFSTPDHQVSFSLSEYANVAMFSRLLQIWKTEITTQSFNKSLNAVVEQCKSLITRLDPKDPNYKGFLNATKSLLRDFSRKGTKKVADFYFLSEATFNGYLKDIKKELEKGLQNLDSFSNLNKNLNDTFNLLNTIEVLTCLKKKFQKYLDSSFYKMSPWNEDILGKELTINVLNLDGKKLNQNLNDRINTLNSCLNNIRSIGECFGLDVFTSVGSNKEERALTSLVLKTILQGGNVGENSQPEGVKAEFFEDTIKKANNVKDYANFVQELIFRKNADSLKLKLGNAYMQECAINDLTEKIAIANNLKSLQGEHKNYLNQQEQKKKDETLRFLLAKNREKEEMPESEKSWEQNIQKYGMIKTGNALSSDMLKIQTLLNWYKNTMENKIKQLEEKKFKADQSEEVFKREFGKDIKTAVADENLAREFLAIKIDWVKMQVVVSEEENNVRVIVSQVKESNSSRAITSQAISGNKTDIVQKKSGNSVKSMEALGNVLQSSQEQKTISPKGTVAGNITDQEYSRMAKTINELNIEKNQLQTANHALAKREEDLKQQVDKLNNQLKVLQNELGNLQDENRILVAENGKLNDQIRQMQSANLNSVNPNIMVLNNSRSADVEKSKQENDALKNQQVSQNNKSPNSQQVVNGSVRDFKEFEGDKITIRNLRRELEEMRNKNRSEEEEEFQEMLQGRQQMIDSLQKELEDRANLQNKKQAELDAREKRLEQRERELKLSNRRI